MATQTQELWTVDPAHSEIQFKVKHLVISTVSGSFEAFEGTVETKNGEFENADISFTADVNSVSTNQEDRDNHLKSDDFFHAEKYPKLKFNSTSVNKAGDQQYQVVGDLTIRDVTNEIALDVVHGGTVEDHLGNTKAGFELAGTIDRKEFGLTYSAVTEAGNVVVGNEVKLLMNVQLAKN
jgi:polyisoprenoid-binding protein YceI